MKRAYQITSMILSICQFRVFAFPCFHIFAVSCSHVSVFSYFQFFMFPNFRVCVFLVLNDLSLAQEGLFFKK